LGLLAIVGCLAIFGIPLALVGRDTMRGAAMMVRNRALIREVAVAAGFGICAGVPATLLAAGLLKALSAPAASTGKKYATALAAIAAMPGLLGSLIISLAVLALFRTGMLGGTYNTPLPAVVALVAFLLPRALLLQILLHAARPRHGTHLSNLLRVSGDPGQQRSSRELDWILHRRGQFLAACMVCLWAYWELTPVAILAPPGMTSAPVRLYNFMHYSRNDVLSAMTLTAMLAPALLMAAAVGIQWLAVRLRRPGRD
jgi:iron(III) transport system permease protein